MSFDIVDVSAHELTSVLDIEEGHFADLEAIEVAPWLRTSPGNLYRVDAIMLRLIHVG